jgi:Fe-S cluster assembly scaffold protein SufB
MIIKKPGVKKIKMILNKEGENKDLAVIIVGRTKGDYLLDVDVVNKASNTTGKVKIYGVAENGARIVVRGMVKIEKKLSKIDDFLEIRLLILDDISEATADPQLEIESDDVKASHAATVSKIDEEQIFYLQSRGVGRRKASDLIVEGFLGG